PFYFMLPRPLSSTLFPYTTLFRSNQSIKFYVSVYPPQTYSIDFYRIGWYGGLGGRLRLNVPALLGTTQAPCVPDVSTGTQGAWVDRKSTRLNSSHVAISYAVFCLK